MTVRVFYAVSITYFINTSYSFLFYQFKYQRLVVTQGL